MWVTDPGATQNTASALSTEAANAVESLGCDSRDGGHTACGGRAGGAGGQQRSEAAIEMEEGWGGPEVPLCLRGPSKAPLPPSHVSPRPQAEDHFALRIRCFKGQVTSWVLGPQTRLPCPLKRPH